MNIQVRTKISAFTLVLMASSPLIQASAGSASRDVYFGDTHLHTSYSFDAFLNSNQSADPDTAYRWAKGLPVIHPYHRARVQIDTPLDFLVVADHAELMGVMRAVYNDRAELEDLGWFGNTKRWLAIWALKNAVDEGAGFGFFQKLLPIAGKNVGGDPVQDPNNSLPTAAFGDTRKVETRAWENIVDAAERHNQPGTFTSLIGWEWSSIPTGANLHRIVITPDGAEKAKQYLPYGSDQSQYPEDLWQWLSETEAATGSRFISIPHNSNISKGYMFADTTLKGEVISAQYAKTRASREPIVEITQIKGDSETHPALSPDDEFADFETYTNYIEQGLAGNNYKAGRGDFVRSALKQGLAIEAKVGVNPFKFGVIGSTDSHTGLASAEETNFMGKLAADSIPENKLKDGRNYWRMAAQGLAAVWAPENTRESLFAAFKRKEVYATTGPRLRVRVFAGWDFSAEDLNSEHFAAIGYRKGVPMGGDLSYSDEAPQLMVRAVKDPKGANLDRVQIIKGWLNSSGQPQEKIYNISWAGNRQLDGQGKLPALANTIDADTLKYTNTIGAAELTALWTDPNFNSSEKAFYYIRVLQIATPRHSSYDTMALQQGAAPEVAESIQERAYTSPIWYTP